MLGELQGMVENLISSSTLVKLFDTRDAGAGAFVMRISFIAILHPPSLDRMCGLLSASENPILQNQVSHVGEAGLELASL